MEYIKLKDAFSIKKGKKVEVIDDINENIIRCIQIGDLRNNDNLKYCLPSEKHVFANENDILIAWDGANAGTVGVGLKGALGSTLAKLELKAKALNPYFVALLLQSKFDYFQQTATGATIPHISRKALEEISLPILPLEGQKKIVTVIQAVNSIIEKRQSQIVALDELVQSVFLDMFGNIVQDNKWNIMDFGDICETRLGKMLDKKRQDHLSQKYYLGNRHVQWGNFELDNLPQMGFSEQELEKFALKKGDLLICEGGEVGRCAIWQWNDRDIYFQKALHRARVNKNLATAEYVQYVMFFFSQNNGFKDYTTTSTIAHLTGVKLNKLPIPLPPIELQDAFGEKIKKVEKQKILLEKSLKEIQSLYNSLVHMAFHGELFQEE